MASAEAAFESAASPALEPLRGSRYAIAVALLFVAIPLSGLPRYLTGITMGVSLCLVLAGVLGLVAILWPILGVRTKTPSTLVLGCGVAFVLSLFALRLLWSAPFDGLPASSCADGGNHVFARNLFDATDPKVYEGMFALYALAHWLIQLGMDDLSAFRLAWQLSVEGCIVLVSATVVAGVRVSGTGARGALYATALITTTLIAVAGSAFVVAFPLLHYYQSDGYFAQLFSLVPLALLIGTYAFASRRLTRLLAILLCLPFYRFTYLLNAGDLMLCCAAMVLTEWRQAPQSRPVRLGLLVLAAMLTLGSVAGYVGLARILKAPGGFRSAPLGPQVTGLALLSVVLGSVGPVSGRLGFQLNPAHARLARFLALFTGAPAVLVAAWLLTGHKPIYYIEKYAFCAIVLGSLGIVPIVLSAAFGLVSQGKGPLAGVAASAWVVGTGAGLFGLASSADAYTPWFHERYTDPPYGYLEPHAERAVWQFIANTLKKEHALFGGFLTPRWPESQFTNAHFIGAAQAPPGAKGATSPGTWTRANYNAIFQGETVESGGHCVFWYESKRLSKRLQDRWSKGSRAAVDRLQDLPPRSCQLFTPRSAPARRQAVCGACFSGQNASRRLPINGNLEGFHGMEHDTDGSDVRWTTGDGKLPFTLTDAEMGCEVRVQIIGDSPYELWVDGSRLGEGPRRALGKLSTPGPHLLEIRSPTFVPKLKGDSEDGRTLGVRVSKVTLECRVEPPPGAN